jgi:hypothetical protein
MVYSTFECDTYSSTIIHKNLPDEELVTIRKGHSALDWGLSEDDNEPAALINVLGNRLRNIGINNNETSKFFHPIEFSLFTFL